MAIKITGVNIIDDGFNILNLAKISAGASFGTAGQVLTSGGPSANVSWAAVSAGTGRLLRAPQILTSGTSYTTPAGCTGIYVEAVGGGGGGGSTGGGAYGSGGGGGGAYVAKYFTVTASTAYTYAIGAGGAGGAPGGTGGNTTFTVGGTTIIAQGGVGGVNSGDGGTGGIGLNGDFNIQGGTGHDGSTSGTTYRYGHGGSSFFGFGGKRSSTGTGYGGGGGGVQGSGGSGGSGTAGVIRVWDFA